MDVCLINNHLPHFSFVTHLLLHYSWDCLTVITAQKMLEQTCIAYNDVRSFYHSSRSWKYPDFFVKTETETFSSTPRSRPRLLSQDQDQDHFTRPRLSTFNTILKVSNNWNSIKSCFQESEETASAVINWIRHNTTYIIKFLFHNSRVFLFDFSRPISIDTYHCAGTISISGKWNYLKVLKRTGIISLFTFNDGTSKVWWAVIVSECVSWMSCRWIISLFNHCNFVSILHCIPDRRHPFTWNKQQNTYHNR